MKDEGCLDNFGGTSRRRPGADVSQLLAAQTTYGGPIQQLVLPLTGGKEFIWDICDPFAILSFMGVQSSAFAAVLKAAVQRYPSGTALAHYLV